MSWTDRYLEEVCGCGAPRWEHPLPTCEEFVLEVEAEKYAGSSGNHWDSGARSSSVAVDHCSRSNDT